MTNQMKFDIVLRSDNGVYISQVDNMTFEEVYDFFERGGIKLEVDIDKLMKKVESLSIGESIKTHISHQCIVFSITRT